jgi:hypothetical protein
LTLGDRRLSRAIAEAGGIGLRITCKAPELLFALPRYIPRVEPRRGFLVPESIQTVAVPIDRAGAVGAILTAAEVKTKFGLADSTRIVLSFHQADRVLETRWANRALVCEQIALAGYDLVLAPGYSVWSGDPFIHAQRNRNRSIRYYEMLALRGVPAVLHVSWRNYRGVEDWCEVLKDHRIGIICIDLQIWKQASDWSLTAMHELRALASGLDGACEVIVNGVSHERRLRLLGEIFGHIHLVNSTAFNRAMLSSTDERIGIFTEEVNRFESVLRSSHERCRFVA